MDIPRKSRKVRKIVIRVIAGLIAATAIGAITLGLSRLEPAAPSVERQTLLIDSVKRGDIFLEVRGVGMLVSEDMLVVPARVSGRASRILIQAGTPVEPNTIILELSNPQLELNWMISGMLQSRIAIFRGATVESIFLMYILDYTIEIILLIQQLSTR